MVTAKKRVLVALSGGVDSSVAAALLQEQGYDVEGAFIVTWTAPWLPCTWREERLDAMRVAAQLRIPFHTVDLAREYERDVVHYLVEEYRVGRTPNPDVMCNKYIKFGGLFDWAMKQGFDYVATGHYARVRSSKFQVPSPQLPPSHEQERRVSHKELGARNSLHGTQDEQLAADYSLLTGVDANKDQSYFLWTLTQRHLAHTLFPVGTFEKSQVRHLAVTFNLPTAQKKDSQGVCFLGKIDMKDFLQHYITSQEGQVLDLDGNVIGSHDGAMFVTLGQRHGFQVKAQTPNAEPVYVVAKDITANTVTVASQNDVRATVAADAADQIFLADTNWISGVPATAVETGRSVYAARFRYRQSLFPIRVQRLDGPRAVVVFSVPQHHVSVGQSLVLYEGDRCVGGGVIEQVVHSR